MAHIGGLRPETNRILCEASGFVYIRFEVKANGYQLIHSLTPLRRVHLDKLTADQLVKKIPIFLLGMKFHCQANKSKQPVTEPNKYSQNSPTVCP